MPKFYGNPDYLRKIANEIRELAEEAKEKSVDISRYIDDKLPSAWSGDASVTYRTQYENLTHLIINIENSLMGIGGTVINVADSLEKGEENNWQE